MNTAMQDKHVPSLRSSLLALADRLEDVCGESSVDNRELSAVEEELRALATQSERSEQSTEGAAPPQQERAAVADGWVLVLRLNLEALRKDFANDYCRKSPTFDAWLNSIECMLSAAPAAPATPDESSTIPAQAELLALAKQLEKISVPVGEDGYQRGRIVVRLNAIAAAMAATPESAEPVAWPLYLGREYRTQGGETVRFVTIHNAGTPYESMEDENGVHRYTRRPGDLGRVTGSAHDYSHPGNIIRPTPAASDGAQLERFELRLTDRGNGGEMVACANGGWVLYSAATASDGGLREVIAEYLNDLRSDCAPRPDGQSYGLNAQAVRMWIEEFEEALATPPTEQAKPSEVLIDFPQAGMARPFAVVNGKITLPDVTMSDLVSRARMGFVKQSTSREPVAAPAQVTDAEVEAMLSAPLWSGCANDFLYVSNDDVENEEAERDVARAMGNALLALRSQTGGASSALRAAHNNP